MRRRLDLPEEAELPVSLRQTDEKSSCLRAPNFGLGTPWSWTLLAAGRRAWWYESRMISMTCGSTRPHLVASGQRATSPPSATFAPCAHCSGNPSGCQFRSSRCGACCCRPGLEAPAARSLRATLAVSLYVSVSPAAPCVTPDPSGLVMRCRRRCNQDHQLEQRDRLSHEFGEPLPRGCFRRPRQWSWGQVGRKCSSGNGDAACRVVLHLPGL
mmetsp:Transcript_77819/g.207914  ORF Transcript_77819/g.207914 Transcript_77819/m.207914 type:complete len:213 (+) Transcript_77819:994-1632(+)